MTRNAEELAASVGDALNVLGILAVPTGIQELRRLFGDDGAIICKLNDIIAVLLGFSAVVRTREQPTQSIGLRVLAAEPYLGTLQQSLASNGLAHEEVLAAAARRVLETLGFPVAESIVLDRDPL